MSASVWRLGREMGPGYESIVMIALRWGEAYDLCHVRSKHPCYRSTVSSAPCASLC